MLALAALAVMHDWTPKREFRFVAAGVEYVYLCDDTGLAEQVRHRAEGAHQKVLAAAADFEAEAQRISLATFPDPEAELAPARERFVLELEQVKSDFGCAVDIMG